MLDPATSAVVRQSWQRLRAQETSVSKAFYAAMFAARPAYREMFQRGLHDQEKMFAQMMSLIIGVLDLEVELRYLLRGLGSRHRGYGVATHRFDELQTYLLAALRSVGKLSALEVDAWNRVLSTIAQQMAEGADSGPLS